MCHPGRVRPTLRTILASAALRRGRAEVLSGHDRLERPVRWVHVGEVRELAGLLSGGELILSTGLAMSGAPADAVRYLEELVAAGAAGLFVELGERFPQVPEVVVRAARRLDFPLVALHQGVRFVEVTEEVHRRIVAEQLEQVEFAREVHERFTALSLEAADAPAIVAATAALCDCSVLLEDLARHVVAFEARHRPAGGLLADWERRSRAAAVLDRPGLCGPEGWMTAPVGSHGRTWGRLVVPDPALPQARLGMLLERAAQALELGRMVERDRLGLELRAQGGLLADLAAGRAGTEEAASARAAALGLPAASMYVGAVARQRSQGPGAAPGDPLADHEPVRHLVEQVVSAARSTGLSALVGTLPGDQVGLVLAVPTSADAARDTTPETRTLDALAVQLPADVVLGVAPPAPSLTGAGAGLRHAGHVAEVAATMPAREGRLWFRNSDVRLRGLLSLLHDDARVQSFVEAELGALLEHDARRGDGLLDLLRQYVDAGGNVTRLAAATHRSRASVYKKLDRLERLLGVALDDPASLLSLGVAVTAYDEGRRR
ncbi:MAG: PucR family transcriptional regulator, purine catabolism regulatory protein [Nocardioidaceae bacterium]|nr:PucR family transcriptional regulator, purine catabolism regulatory protein [Nocardioidaceae bacterium]